jgi:hypothetical protein
MSNEEWVSKGARSALKLHVVTIIIAILLTGFFYHYFPQGPVETFLVGSLPTLLATLTAFLSIFLAIIAFYLTFLEQKRAGLVSQKIALSKDPLSNLIDPIIRKYRDTGKAFLRFSKAVVVTFAIVILLLGFGYSRTGWVSTPDSVLVIIDYLGILSFGIAVIDIFLVLLFFSF